MQKNLNSQPRKMLSFTLSFAVLLILLFSGNAVLGGQKNEVSAWSREHEPVILLGAQVPGLDGVDISHLFAYANIGGVWIQVPIQVDEVDSNGVFIVEDGVLDGNDEIVFMAKDGGTSVPPSQWIENQGSKVFPRYEIQTTNPLIPSEISYLYIYSATLPATYEDYVDWNLSKMEIQSSVYSMSITNTTFIGLDSLSLNGHDVDILDRSKFVASVRCYYQPGMYFDTYINEETLSSLWNDLIFPLDGAVRVGGGAPGLDIWAYRSAFQIQTGFNFSGFTLDACPAGVTFNWARFSLDLLNPDDTGFSTATYYDRDTTAGVPIDGTHDPEVGTAAVPWSQVSGNYGSMVQLRDFSITSGDIQNYYLDSDVFNAMDTGDGYAYGDSGLIIYSPSGTLLIDLEQIFLDPNLGPIGETYHAYKENPLAVAVAEQWHGERYPVFIPLILSSNP